MNTGIIRGRPSTHGDRYQLNTSTLIRHAARTYPEQEIVFRTPDGGWDRYTYADCYTRIKKAANVLRRLGVGPADVVGILDWNSQRHFELYWAIPNLGAVMLQMNLRLSAEDLGYVTAHSDASWVLVDESLLPVAEALAPHAPNVKGWIVMTDKPLPEISTTLPGVHHFETLLAAADAEIDWPVIDETSAYSACYTTGTTGRPKGIFYSHRGIYLHTLTMVADLGMRSRDAVMLVTPMFHGQCWGLPQAAVRAAAKVVLPGRYMAHDTKVLVDAMIAEGVTVANGAPAIFQPMLDYISSLEVKPDLSRARLLSGATEPPLSLMRGLYETTGADVIHAYGATETTPLVAINYGIKSTLDDKLSSEQCWDRKRYQGLMVSGVDYRLIDAAGNDLPFDGVSQGEVLLRGPWIIESYAKLADGTDRFLDGYWRSGDAGAIDKHGYLKITDRIKDVIKSGVVDLLDRHGERHHLPPPDPGGRGHRRRAPHVARTPRRHRRHPRRHRSPARRDPRSPASLRQVAATRHGRLCRRDPADQRRQDRQESAASRARRHLPHDGMNSAVHRDTETTKWTKTQP